jgi:hypothetical protein
MSILLLTLPVALSQGLPELNLPAPDQQTTNRAGTSAGTNDSQRPYIQEVNLRIRYAFIPDSVFDLYFYNGDTDNGNHLERPSVSAFATGIEYVIRNEEANGIFYFEYMPNMTGDGYWDDKEDPPNYDDGDYIAFSGLATYNIGANYGFEVRLQPWFSLMFGGGLGLSIITGEVQKWDGGMSANGTYVRPWESYEENPDNPDGTHDIPSVLPMVDIFAAMRFSIAENASIRLEGGLHNLIYGGLTAGIVF